MTDFDKILHVGPLEPEETIESDFLKIESLRAEIEGGAKLAPPPGLNVIPGHPGLIGLINFTNTR